MSASALAWKNEVHKLLERQRLHLAPAGPPPPDEEWQTLANRIDRAYTDADRDRYMLERAIAISSEEMGILHERLRSERDNLRVTTQAEAP